MNCWRRSSINPNNGAWYFNTGLTLDALGRFDEAIDAYRQSLQIDADHVDSMNHLGVDLYRVGRFEEALHTFEQIQGIDPSFEPSYCHRIMTYAEMGEHEKAEEMFYTARLYKDQCPQCYYNMGCSLAARGLYDKAIFCWQSALDLDESNPDLHPRIAEALWGKGGVGRSPAALSHGPAAGAGQHPAAPGSGRPVDGDAAGR